MKQTVYLFSSGVGVLSGDNTPLSLPTAICWSTGAGEGNLQQKEKFQTQNENVAKETLEQPVTLCSSEVKKTWGFRRSTVLKREMPVEAVTNSPENPCPVRRSGRQSKRTDKLEEFLLTTKRGLRKSDPPSQTPTDAETTSEASFDGNADTKMEDKVECSERRTRSSTRKQTQRKTRSSRQTRSSGGMKDEGSSENEEGEDAVKKEELHGNNEEKEDAKSEITPADVGGGRKGQPQPELDSKTEVKVEVGDHEETNDTAEVESDSDEDSADTPAAMVVKRGPIRTYINKTKAPNKNSASLKAAAPVKKENIPKPAPSAVNPRIPQKQEDDEDEDEDDDGSSTSSSSSSSVESDEGGYDPNALYCICRQKHNKRYLLFGSY